MCTDVNTKESTIILTSEISVEILEECKVKQNVEPREELIENIIKDIQENCDEIKLMKPHSEESKIIGKVGK